MKSLGKTKIFCIGRNKTGTTSLESGLTELGFQLCDMGKAKYLVDAWIERDFRPIVRYCRSAQVFSDQPFNLPNMFVALDQAFPNSKFILTVRDSPEQWYESLCSHMAKRYGHGQLPTLRDLESAEYVYPGWIAKTYPEIHGVDPADLFCRERLVRHYHSHNDNVLYYFKNRPDDFLRLNVSDPDSWQRLCDFLGVESDRREFPWVNKAADIRPAGRN